MATDFRALMGEINPDALVIGEPGERRFDSAIIGHADRGGSESADVLVYDYHKIVDVLVKDGMSLDDAIEYVDFNILRAWFGPNTPLILHGD